MPGSRKLGRKSDSRKAMLRAMVTFLIENGKITCALSETMISACVPDMLNNIRDISCDVLQDGSLSVPYIAFDGVTISGQ